MIEPREHAAAGNRIREIRERWARMLPATFAIDAVADRIGVTASTLRRWEQGEARPTRRHARALARQLGVAVKELGLDEGGE